MAVSTDPGVGDLEEHRVLTVPGRQQESTRQSDPFMAVVGWELRRVTASRTSLVAAGAAFLFFGLIMLLLRDSQTMFYGDGAAGLWTEFVRVAGTSPWGLSIAMPKYLLLVLGLFIPFIAAEGVARDVRRRTHEMLMSTQIPTWAYVLGRYAAVLVVTLSLALLLLAATLTVAMGLNVWLGYPSPNVAATLALWAVAVLPAAIFVSSLSFVLGTLWPRHANFAKTLIVVLWVLAQFSAALWEHEQSPYAVIDPAAVVMTQVIQGPYAQTYAERISTLAAGQPEGQSVQREQALHIVREVEQMMPDLWPWVLPRLAYATFGLLAVSYAAARFRRFHNA